MKTRFLNLRVVTCISALMAFTSSADAQQPAAKPRELEPLARFVGTWKEVTTAKPALWTPDGAQTTARGTRRWILGGRMLENKGTWEPGGIEFLHLMTYDAQENEYRQWYFESSGLMPRGTDHGQWDAKTQTFTWKGEMGAGVKSEAKVRFIDEDTFVWNVVAKDAAGNVYLDMSSKATRVKDAKR